MWLQRRWLVLGAFLLFAMPGDQTSLLWQVASYAQETQKPKDQFDYRNPPREYEVRKLGRWSIQVEKQLVTDDPALAKKALERLEKKLNQALTALPKATHPTLLKLDYFLMYGPKAKGGGRTNGLEYFRKGQPERHPNLDPRWESCVVVHSAENYVQISDFWALKAVVHELAHAQHLENGPENQPDIRAAWDNAEKLQLYRNVKDEKGKLHEKAYAATNHLEYFAELSCMYFVGCNYPPLNRQEFKKYDPEGYDMIQKMWGLKK